MIAAFTVVLAISTIGLWVATKRLWEAGEVQIRIASRTADAGFLDWFIPSGDKPYNENT